MILETFILKNNAIFLNKNGEKVVFGKDTKFGTLVDKKGNINYVDENGDCFTSIDPRLPIQITHRYVTLKPTLFYVVDNVTNMIVETRYLTSGVEVLKTERGYSYHTVDGSKSYLKCVNEENLERVLIYPAVAIKAEAEDNTDTKKKVFKLNPDAKYCGDDGIDAAVLFLQTADLSKHIVRDDKSHTLFVDLGPSEMWTDIDNPDWIMKLNARIPLASAVSIGKRMLNGKQRLAVVLNSNFV